MARGFVSPMGDPTWAAATASLADALFPDARKQAAIKMAGAQYQGQLLGNDQTSLENDDWRRRNTNMDALGGLIVDPTRRAAILGGGGNASQLAEAIGKYAEQDFRQGARDRAVRGDWTGANGELFGVASGPQRINDIDSGYQLNPFVEGGDMNATSATLADIVVKNAQAANQRAQAGQHAAQAGYWSERTANPGKFHAPGAGRNADGKLSETTPAELKTIEAMIVQSLPDGAQYSGADTLAAAARASELFRAGGDAGAAITQAMQETLRIDPADDGTVIVSRVPAGGGVDWIDPPPVGGAPSAMPPAGPAGIDWIMPPPPGPAAAPAAPAGKPVRARNPKTGQMVELRNGQWVPVQ